MYERTLDIGCLEVGGNRDRNGEGLAKPNLLRDAVDSGSVDEHERRIEGLHAELAGKLNGEVDVVVGVVTGDEEISLRHERDTVYRRSELAGTSRIIQDTYVEWYKRGMSVVGMPLLLIRWPSGASGLYRDGVKAGWSALEFPTGSLVLEMAAVPVCAPLTMRSWPFGK